jgi:hypothetical protein
MKLVIIVLFLAVLCLVLVSCKHSKLSVVNQDYLFSNYEDKIIQRKHILVFQCGAYTSFPEYATLGITINKAYCLKWGYTYINKIHSIEEAPPYWLKILDFYTFLNGDWDYICYLDYDAVFYDFKRSIEAFIQPLERYSLLIGEDNSPFVDINAGVIIIKNNEISKKLIQTWLSYCFSDFETKERFKYCKPWIFKEGKWNCPRCIYARNNYEQGIFNSFIYKKFKQDIGILPISYISNNNPDKDSFILHLYNHTDKNRTDIFTKLNLVNFQI